VSWSHGPDFHIGFVLENEEGVRAHHERLLEAGVPMKADLSIGGPNLYFVCIGPDAIPVEVSGPRDATENTQSSEIE
jgi:hypothetical protein